MARKKAKLGPRATNDEIAIAAMRRFRRRICAIPRRMELFNIVIESPGCSFDGIQQLFLERTGSSISTGSLHYHLKELVCYPLITRDNGRPGRYAISSFAQNLLGLPERYRKMREQQYLNELNA